MLKRKQMKLGKLLLTKVKHKFPELQLVNITENAENPNHVWVNVVMPEDEDREIDLGAFASEISTDILLEHGCLVTLQSAYLPA